MKSMADALAALNAAMESSQSTTDPDRRRAAARLSELIRADDAQLARFASRYLPGRSLDDEALRDMRGVAVDLSRLVALQGKSPAAAALLAEIRALLVARLDAAEEEAARPPPSADSEGSTPTESRDEEGGPAPPPRVVVPVITSVDPGGRAFPVPSFALPSGPDVSIAAPPRAAGGQGEDDHLVPDRVTLPPDSKLRANPATPFADGPAPIPRPASAPVAPERPSGTRIDDDVYVARNGTAPGEFRAAPAAVLPFKPTHNASAPAPAPMLPPNGGAITLEMHAVLSAMVFAFPWRRAEVLARYGLRDDAELAALDQHWRSRLDGDPAARAAWTSVRDQALAHYRGQRG